MTAATPGQAAYDWWVCDGILPPCGTGKKIIGPFATQELALSVRAYVEKAGQRSDLWVDDEPAARQPHAADGDVELLKRAADALWNSAKAALVVEHSLDKPYEDDPRWSPWTRWVERPAREAHDLAMVIRKRLKAAPEEPKTAPGLAAAMAESRTLRTDLDEATGFMLAHHDGAVQRRARLLRKRAGLPVEGK